MEFYDEKIKALAIEIYELDAEVYKKLGSSLGRVFGGEKDICIRNIMEDLHSRQNSSRIRSELALISNMARTIPDHDTRHDIMVRYNNIVEEIAELPTGFADGDILDPRTNIKYMFIGGRLIPLTSRHTELFESFKDRK